MKKSDLSFLYLFFLGALAVALALSGCARSGPAASEVSDANLVTAGATAPRAIGDSTLQFTVTPRSLLASSEAATDDGALILGLPMSLLGKQNIFGGVITKVSDRNNEDLGMLKLTDLPPVPVIPKLEKDKDGKTQLGLYGCVSGCTPEKETELLVTLPVLSVDDTKQLVMLDLSAVGRDLDLIGMLDPKGQATKLKTRSARTVAVDYSQSTLVFDVESHMVAVNAAEGDALAPETVFTTRWYLKLNSVTDPGFVSRAPVAAAGFFQTQRGSEAKITRFSNNAGPIKYYLKDIPAEFQPSFAAAFEGWNTELQAVLGKKLLSYEFVNADDPRSKLLVPGDVRYNIVAWDLVNRAPYGGLGPSIADQFTGQTFAANVLIQGPHIVDMYRKWFTTGESVHSLTTLGMADAAEQLLLKTKRELQASLAALKSGALTAGKIELKLGHNLAFRVASQRPELEDSLMDRDDFDALPDGETFESYMPGYFQDMLTHELGHNLGLRHNFRGTLGAAQGAPAPGRVSRSIMDYMGRDYRYFDRVGDYDRMAIAYGYAGLEPQHHDWFCTDEDTGAAAKPQSSAECSKEDATDDPFSFFEANLTRSISLLLNRSQPTAPNWTVEDMKTMLTTTISGLLNYAASAEKTGSQWTNFFNKGDRPLAPAQVKGYVLARINAQLCDASIQEVLARKQSQAARDATSRNISELKAKVADIAKEYNIFSSADFGCP